MGSSSPDTTQSASGKLQGLGRHLSGRPFARQVGCSSSRVTISGPWSAGGVPSRKLGGPPSHFHHSVCHGTSCGLRSANPGGCRPTNQVALFVPSAARTGGPTGSLTEVRRSRSARHSSAPQARLGLTAYPWHWPAVAAGGHLVAVAREAPRPLAPAARQRRCVDGAPPAGDDFRSWCPACPAPRRYGRRAPATARPTLLPRLARPRRQPPPRPKRGHIRSWEKVRGGRETAHVGSTVKPETETHSYLKK